MKDTDLDFIHRFVPPNSSAKEAKLALLLLHGTGGNEDDSYTFGKRIGA